MGKKNSSFLKKVIGIVLGIFFIVIMLILLFFLFLSSLATMPSEENLTMNDNPKINNAIKGYLVAAVDKNNPPTKDYYGNDKAYLNNWPILQSMMLTYCVSNNTDYTDNADVKAKISKIAHDIRPILSYKPSKRTTIHQYTIEYEEEIEVYNKTTGEYETKTVTKTKEVTDTTHENVELLTEADSIFLHHQYDYKETTETVSDGSGGTYTYIYEEVSNIREIDEPEQRLKEYVRALIDIDREEDIEEALEFILSTNYAYENKIENAYLTGDGDYEFGSFVPGSREVYKDIPIIDADNATREDVVTIAKSLLAIIEGKDPLPYFWGGKYPEKGVNVNWGKLRPIQARGNSNWPIGTPLPLGLDCSGYVDWVYMQVTGQLISDMGGGGGAAAQFYACRPIRESELKPGDLGFQSDPFRTGGSADHVGIFIGRDTDGVAMFIHSGGTIYKKKNDPFYRAGRVTISKLKGNYGDNPSVLFRYFGRLPIKFQGE